MSTDLIFENAQLKGRVITLDAEVKCLEAVIRSHERVDCLSVTSLKKQLLEVDAEVARLNSLIANSEHENARLKAEVKRLNADLPKMVAWGRGLEHDKRLLEEQVSRLRALDSLKTLSLADSPTWQTIGAYAEAKEEVSRLKAEVERLTEAGNAMALCFNCPTCAKSWHAAKEGKQS
jgi:chromosome segregation ATPase